MDKKIMNFKNYILKENQEFWPEEDIQDWITDNGHRVLKKYNIEPIANNGEIQYPELVNGKVNCKRFTISSHGECLPLMPNSSNLRQFPCQFGVVTGSFFAGDCDLGTLKGAPETVGAKFSISNNKNITSIEYLPKYAGKYILRGTMIKSFSGIHKIVKEIISKSNEIEQFVLPFSAKEAFLGFLLIKNCNEIGYSSTSTAAMLPADLGQAILIVNEHLSGNKDLLECQEELISAGLKSYAKL